MKTVAHEVSDRFTIKKSEFIGIIVPVTNMAEAVDRVAHTWTQFDGARHIAWAAKVANRVRMSDDGEPSGTAGMPILNVLQHQDIHQVLLMVVRYYGGIKLGAGGLTRAYSQAASLAVQAAQTVEFVAKIVCQISVSFAKEAQVRHLIQQYDADILETLYEANWTVVIQLVDQVYPEFHAQLTDLCQGQVTIATVTDDCPERGQSRR